MKKSLYIMFKLLLGLVFCALSTVMALKSNLGLSPWDVFHQGLSNVTGLTIGQANIIVGVVLVVITFFFKAEIGFGTIMNMVVIGIFVDIIMHMGVVPDSNNLIFSIIMLLGSLFTMAIGSYLYMSCAMGCGPRDGLMVVLLKLTGIRVGIIRCIIEFSALAIGWLMGGKVGLGTVITVAGIGYCLELVFKIFNFDAKSIKHKNLKDCVVYLNKSLSKS